MATLTMERRFTVSPQKLFAHLTQTQSLLQWWGPEGTTIREHALSFALVGPWSAVMVSPAGDAHEVGGEVLAVEPYHMVQFTLKFRMPDGTNGPESTIRFDLAADGAGTKLLLTQTGLEPEHIEDMRNKGWNSALSRLATLTHFQPNQRT